MTQLSSISLLQALTKPLLGFVVVTFEPSVIEVSNMISQNHITRYDIY